MITVIREAKSWVSTIKTNQQLVVPRSSATNRDGRWNPPGVGIFKLNMDGTVYLTTKKASSGGAIRDYKGNWIAGYTRNIGCCSVSRAEYWAVINGLEIAWDLGLQQVIVEMDSIEAVCCLQASPQQHEPTANPKTYRSTMDHHILVYASLIQRTG
ncbi:hypothetical protein F3Y22_tig00110393pilonHSYRG00026 [Hibiscus syriacus]|uniref:RNase H type-1 domain-containing protein n=1 Tax=Hibiscus syriacus TaxID=106335 RepID=A0A6A3AR46_HIBSY|nr:hypothetical protein F3Y22_tig00110393pilonHSYRG00026 [Hibiscus syriacus]